MYSGIFVETRILFLPGSMIGMLSCSRVQPVKNARDDSAVISQYMLEHLSDPSAYEPLDYFFATNGQQDDRHIVEHDYRRKGDLVIPPIENIFFLFDANGSIVQVMDMKEYVTYNGGPLYTKWRQEPFQIP